MPIIKSAVKRMKQTATRRQRNIATKRAIKASTKAFAAEPSAAALSQAQEGFAQEKHRQPPQGIARQGCQDRWR